MHVSVHITPDDDALPSIQVSVNADGDLELRQGGESVALETRQIDDLLQAIRLVNEANSRRLSIDELFKR